MTSARPRTSTREVADVIGALGRWLQRELTLDDPPTMRVLGGPSESGFSSETVLFDLADTEHAGRYALRLPPPPEAFPLFPWYDLERQVAAMRLVGERTAVPVLSYNPMNRRLLRGRVHCTMVDGSSRTLQVEVLSDTGFHLGGGLYFGFDGRHHGEWRGALHVDGERIDDCSTKENARRRHQIRDTVVKITDPVGGGVGYGNWQPIAAGEIPELGLDADTSFI